MINFNGGRLLNCQEVAHRLGVNPSTVRAWVSRKEIPFMKLGPGCRGTVRFDPDALNQWIRERASLLQGVS